MRVPISLKLACPAILVAVLLGCLGVLGYASAPALAVVPTGGLTVHDFAPEGRFSEALPAPYRVRVTNSASVSSQEPVVIKDVLPAGFTVASSGLFFLPQALTGKNAAPEPLGACAVEEPPATTTVTVTCTYAAALEPDQGLELEMSVSAGPGSEGAGPNAVSVTAAGTLDASLEEPLPVGSPISTFGASSLVAYLAGTDGEPDSQAGGHPYEMTTRIDLHSITKPQPNLPTGLTSVHDLKDVVFDLPMGLVGDAQATPKCTFAELASEKDCPIATRVGQIHTAPSGPTAAYTSVYNLVPEQGAAAEFGFQDGLHSPHAIYAGVAPTPSGYVLRATTREVPQVPLTEATVTFFGNPAAKDESGNPPVAFFTNPSDCSSGLPRVATVHLDSWQEPGPFADNGTPAGEPGVSAAPWVTTTSGSEESPPVTGCSQLSFHASAFTFAPEVAHQGADEPSGYESVLRIPQTETPATLATPPLKTAVVTLPPGVAVSPSAADGLVGCQESGSEGIDFESGLPGHCPDASKVGQVEVITHLLEEHLTGSVFVAQPKCGGSGQAECSEEAAETGGIFAIYMEVGSENTGIHVKLKGKVEVGGNGQYSQTHGLQPGQIRTSFIETPQVAVFSELKLKFNSGPRAPLANPQTCGTFTTNANLEPWSAPESGPNAIEEPSFDISGCENRFAPSFSAGTVNNQAGGYSAFTTTFTRQDREQDLSGITVNMPEGLLGKIAGIEQCPEDEANAGTCGSVRPGSHIGTATAAAGSGSHPFYQSGNVYLTGPYKNAPFGLSVVVPAKAGPYNLGNIVVRASIRINPVTAAVTVVSNPLPQSVDGVPLRVKTVNVTVGEGGNFTFNATNCTPSSVNATLTSTQGAAVPVSSRYSPASCGGLKFAPQFSASTQANGTRKGMGASLDVKVGYPQPYTAYTNIAKVDTSLPLALSSRLTTLQKACTEAQFAADPANCPPASNIGTATASSPLLNAPLTGPAYLVSHGGRAFPDLDIILQGENGVVIDLTGNTDIKKGITYTKFETVPDAPVSSFELNLPEKENSILAAVKNLCAPTKLVTTTKKETKRVHGRVKHVTVKVKKSVPEPLIMPTSITAQNGAFLQQNLKVAVTGCKASKPPKKKTAKKKTKKGKGKK